MGRDVRPVQFRSQPGQRRSFPLPVVRAALGSRPASGKEHLPSRSLSRPGDDGPAPVRGCSDAGRLTDLIAQASTGAIGVSPGGETSPLKMEAF